MRALAVMLLASCAVQAPALPAQHPASATAATGRLAGALPALRPGVVEYSDVPALREGDDGGGAHHHHGQ